jgi:uncharacterized protein YeaO (DUF488 family)
MPVRTKRWNDPVEGADGYRLLICRYRPRGVPKGTEPWDAWCQVLSPSVELHAAAYGKAGAPPIAWQEYETRFMQEMTRYPYWIETFAERVRAGDTLTLLCSSACVDPARCHRTLVKQLIEAAAFPAGAASQRVGPNGVIRGRRKV